MEEKVRLGNRDRGWNDPPSMGFSGGQQGPNSPRRNLLNQRVAMPQNYTSPQKPANALHQPSASGPPMPSYLNTPPPSLPPTNIGPPPHIVPPSSSLTNQPPPDGTAPPQPQGKSLLASSPARLPGNGRASVGTGADRVVPGTIKADVSCEATLAMMKEVLDNCRSSLQKRVITDIEKRLQVLQNCWQNNKLSLPVQQRTAKLAADLKARNYDSAHEVHLSLMVEHVSEVSQWMVGVKKLIHESRKILPQQSDSSHGDEEPNGSKQVPGQTQLQQDQEHVPGLTQQDQELPTEIGNTGSQTIDQSSTEQRLELCQISQTTKVDSKLTEGEGNNENSEMVITAIQGSTDLSCHGDGDVNEDNNEKTENEDKVVQDEGEGKEDEVAEDFRQLNVEQS